jgi:membrane protease YdiL (CAAX protease family)
MSTYFAYSRTAYYAVIAALPLLVAYELLLTLGNNVMEVQVRNAADVWLRMIFLGLGISPSNATLVMILGMILSIPLFRSGSVRLVPSYFGLMLAEAFAYGFTLGIVINYILAFLFSFFQPAYGAMGLGLLPAAFPPGAGLAQGLALSLGAGLFEELFFRVILLSALLYLTRLLLQGWLSVLISITLAAFLFSLAHYVGPLGEPLEIYGFLFRWVAGLLFTVLYYLRGFAITAYAHAIYDVWVITGLFSLVGW